MGALREKMIEEMKADATSRRELSSPTFRRWWDWQSIIVSRRIN